VRDDGGVAAPERMHVIEFWRSYAMPADIFLGSDHDFSYSRLVSKKRKEVNYG